MISDVLCKAVWEIDRYLLDFPDVYAGELRAKIFEVKVAMDELRRELDTLAVDHHIASTVAATTITPIVSLTL